MYAIDKIKDLPDSAYVSVAVAAEHDGVSVKTIRRNYPLKKLSPRRYGVSVGDLRHRGELATAS